MNSDDTEYTRALLAKAMEIVAQERPAPVTTQHFIAEEEEREAAPRTPSRKYVSIKTKPWTEQEYVFYRGHHLVYTVTPASGMIVHFPGGNSLPLRDLRYAGGELQPPRRLRFDKESAEV